MVENKNYSDLIKLTKYDTKTSIFIDYKAIVGIEECEEVKKNGKVVHKRRTRIDTTNCPCYALVAESAVSIHTLIETYIARKQMNERKEIASEVREAVVSDIVKKGRIFKAIKEI